MVAPLLAEVVALAHLKKMACIGGNFNYQEKKILNRYHQSPFTQHSAAEISISNNPNVHFVHETCPQLTNTSNITDNIINTKEKFHIGLNRTQIIHEELYNITHNYDDGVDSMN
ncbi:hypothetical protein PV326_007083, partial [Microctonus aethiopoides]